MGPIQLREQIFKKLLERDKADAIEVVQIEFDLHELYSQMVSLTGMTVESVEIVALKQYSEWLQKNDPPDASEPGGEI